MIISSIIGIVTAIVLTLSIIFFPKIKIKNISIDSYWVIALLGALTMILSQSISIKNVFDGLTLNTSINPLKILCLFICMTILSIYLDEIGFFKKMANIACMKAGNKQIKLFMYLYIITSILTVFTSNDIIILTFTPFICYFCKNANIKATPYLVLEFISANTWSMMFIIGNPTNIYIANMFNIGFFEYFVKMVVPTIMAGLTSFGILFLLFRKDLSKDIEVTNDEEVKCDKVSLIVGLIHLGCCTVLLAISNYINLEMWYITLGFALSLLIITLITNKVRNKKNTEVAKTLKRAPWTLIPFVISMFIIVLGLKENGVTKYIADTLGNSYSSLKYGIASFLSCNLINNIPMSVLFSDILMCNNSINTNAIYSVIAGSNIGAFLTPVGALAGIMWMSILKKHDQKFTFVDFCKYGVIISIPTVLITILFICIM